MKSCHHMHTHPHTPPSGLLFAHTKPSLLNLHTMSVCTEKQPRPACTYVHVSANKHIYESIRYIYYSRKLSVGLTAISMRFSFLAFFGPSSLYPFPLGPSFSSHCFFSALEKKRLLLGVGERAGEKCNFRRGILLICCLELLKTRFGQYFFFSLRKLAVSPLPERGLQRDC